MIEKLIATLKMAKEEIEWWEDNHSCCHGVSDEVYEEIDAVLKQVQQDVYVLVPIEPTDEMCEAAWESDGTDYVGEHHRICRFDLAYKAAIEVAQKGNV